MLGGDIRNIHTPIEDLLTMPESFQTKTLLATTRTRPTTTTRASPTEDIGAYRLLAAGKAVPSEVTMQDVRCGPRPASSRSGSTSCGSRAATAARCPRRCATTSRRSGLHYLLIHFDVPDVDPAAWRLSVGGNVARTVELGLDELRALPATTIPVTLECAGNGRALLEPRPVSQPWLEEAFGNAEWTGTPLRGVLERAGLRPDTAELVFTGADRGVQDGVAHSYARSLHGARRRCGRRSCSSTR